jgi:hypothetical protein
MPIQFTSKDVVIFNGFHESIRSYTEKIHSTAFLIACRISNGDYVISKNRFAFDKFHCIRIFNKVYNNPNSLQFIVNDDGSDYVGIDIDWVKEGF